MTIISVHTPKTAGTTFLQNLFVVFGESNVLLDYGDDPANPSSRWCLDPYSLILDPVTTVAPYKVIHGHFHPSKYNSIEQAFRITFLRHPVDNLISIFRFWSLSPPEISKSSLFSYFKDNKLSVQRFAMLPAIRFLYSRTYFGGFDMSQFDFIGDYKDYSMELLRLGGILGVDFNPKLRLNVTSEIQNDNSHLSIGDLGELFKILAEDIAFYERHAGK